MSQPINQQPGQEIEKFNTKGVDAMPASKVLTYLPAGIFLFLMLPSLAVAQESGVKSFADDPFNHPLTPLIGVLTLLLITIILALAVAITAMRVLRFLASQLDQQRAVKLGVVYVPSPSWWEKTWDKLNATVPIAQEKDIDLGHNFDGIRELDNHLPPWWKGLFYGCIVWGVGYLIVYHVAGSEPLQIDEYYNEVAVADKEIRAFRASQPQEEIDPDKLIFKNDEIILAKGKAVFSGSNCASCHRNDGGGNAIGPNLTDEFWIHGGGIKNVFTIIKTGVVEKGMPAWGKTMSPQDVRSVAFYVMSLQGSNPANPKAPQGELYKAIISDSTQVQASLKTP